MLRKHFHLFMAAGSVNRSCMLNERFHANTLAALMFQYDATKQNYPKKMFKAVYDFPNHLHIRNVYKIYYYLLVVVCIVWSWFCCASIFSIHIYICILPFIFFFSLLLLTIFRFIFVSVFNAKTEWKCHFGKSHENILMTRFLFLFFLLPLRNIQFHEQKYLATRKYLLKVAAT